MIIIILVIICFISFTTTKISFPINDNKNIYFRNIKKRESMTKGEFLFRFLVAFVGFLAISAGLLIIYYLYIKKSYPPKEIMFFLEIMTTHDDGYTPSWEEIKIMSGFPYSFVCAFLGSLFVFCSMVGERKSAEKKGSGEKPIT